MTDDPTKVVDLLLAQARRTVEMCQEAIDNGCDLPEIMGARNKFTAGCAALERTFDPVVQSEIDVHYLHSDEETE